MTRSGRTADVEVKLKTSVRGRRLSAGTGRSPSVKDRRKKRDNFSPDSTDTNATDFLRGSMKLSSNRLFLRDFAIADRDAVHEYASSIDVVRHQAWGPNTLLQTAEFVEAAASETAVAERRLFTLAVVLNDETLIGSVLAAISTDGSEAEIGYSFNPHYWGMGYGTEAVKRLVGYILTTGDVRRIFATCRPENAASINILKKIGMNQERLVRKNILIRGEWCDSLIFGLRLPEREA